MYNQHRISRIFLLLNILRSKPAKTPRTLAGILEVSERSVYRYFDLIKGLGFEIQKDESGKFYLDTITEEGIPFTEKEIAFITQLLASAGKQSTMAKSILQKIGQYSEHETAARHIFETNFGVIIERLTEAIQQKRQVMLLNYYSASSESITNRFVEPVQFTENFEAISAFEIETQSNKYFNIERISEVVVLDTPMSYVSLHEYYKPDIFGFQGREMDKEIEFELSLRASLLLKEEYPISRPFIKPITHTNRYYFKAKVQTFIGAARFVRGFADDVKVLGSEDFIKFLASE
jgi:predicted DNA-binding transcriptional regulator YafY